MHGVCLRFIIVMFIIGLFFNYVKSVHCIYDIIVYNGFVRGNINKRVRK